MSDNYCFAYLNVFFTNNKKIVNKLSWKFILRNHIFYIYTF